MLGSRSFHSLPALLSGGKKCWRTRWWRLGTGEQGLDGRREAGALAAFVESSWATGELGRGVTGALNEERGVGYDIVWRG